MSAVNGERTENVTRWNRLAVQLANATAGIRPEYHRLPLNARDDAARVEAGYRARRRVQPRFEYHPTLPAPGRALHQLADSHSSSNDPWERLVGEHAAAVIGDVDALRTRSGAAVTAASCNRWGSFDQASVNEARAAVQKVNWGRTPARHHDAGELIAVLREAINQVGLHRWAVAETTQMAARAAVDSHQRVLWVRNDARFSRSELRRLVMHEVGGHVMRRANGSQQPNRLMALGLGDYLICEEGIATWLELAGGADSVDMVGRLALRYLVCHTATRSSFADTYWFAREFLDADTAYEMVLRARLGFVDQGEPGGLAKDKAYFEGHRLVARHLRDHPGDLDVLMTGKFPWRMLEHVRTLDAAGLLCPPVWHPGCLLEAG